MSEWKIVCEQTLKTKTSCGENDNDSETSRSTGLGVLTLKPRIYYFTHRRLHTVWSSSDKLKMCHCTFHLYARFEEQGAHHICNSAIKLEDCEILFWCFIQLEATFLLKFLIPSPLPLPPLFFFKVTSLFAQCCAIGVMLRVCCVICCYASTSGMWILSPFYSCSFPLCQKRTNNPVTTIDNTA